MRKVTLSYMEMMMSLTCIFIENGNKQVGRTRRYADTNRIYDILRAAHCPIEDHQIVEENLRQGRPGMVKLTLTDEQYEKLKRS